MFSSGLRYNRCFRGWDLWPASDLSLGAKRPRRCHSFDPTHVGCLACDTFLASWLTAMSSDGDTSDFYEGLVCSPRHPCCSQEYILLPPSDALMFRTITRAPLRCMRVRHASVSALTRHVSMSRVEQIHATGLHISLQCCRVSWLHLRGF